MSSRVTLFLAVILLLGAVIAGYLGWTLSHPADPQPAAVAEVAPKPETTGDSVAKVVAQAQDQLRRSVVVAARNLMPQTPVTAQDLAIEQLRYAPPGSFSKIEDAVGRMPQRVIEQGSWLGENSFEAGGPLARMIHSDERALALSVDSVTGAGGHISPGDYVDVLLFLPQDTENSQKSAQVIVPALRVLSVGKLLGADLRGQAIGIDQTADDQLQARLELHRDGASTVVVAVPSALLTRLMLAVGVGTLRLAVRSSEENLLQNYWAGNKSGLAMIAETNRNLFKFQQVAIAGPVSASANQASPAAAVSAPSRARGIEVIRGAIVMPATSQPAATP